MTMTEECLEVDIQEAAAALPFAPPFHLEEFVNAAIHAIGLVLSIAGACVLIAQSWSHGNTYSIVGCTVFALTLVAVYAASTASHSPTTPQMRQFLRSLDQAVIYLLIAGSYTPFVLVYLSPGWGMLPFGLMWTAALWGFVSKVLFRKSVDVVTLWSYLLLGWMPMLMLPPLLAAVPAIALWWMLIGGLCYTCGTLFLVLDTKYPLFHAVWHVLVMAGSAFHFVTILRYCS